MVRVACARVRVSDYETLIVCVEAEIDPRNPYQIYVRLKSTVLRNKRLILLPHCEWLIVYD